MSIAAIMGLGEVGTAIHKLYTSKNYNVLRYDPYKNLCDDFSNVEILNVCIPCTDTKTFIKNVKDVVDRSSKLKMIIIHSSILLGIVEDLKKYYPKLNIVHSPIRGVHPELYEGITTFVKYIGHQEGDEQSGIEAKIHLDSLGLETVVTTAKTTILMKLLSTTYYGMCIAFTEDMGKICDKENVDFDMISHWTQTYNKGYTELDKKNVCRPVLTRIPDGKHIGGHCVIPNAKLLKKMYPDINAFDYVLKYQ